MRRRDFLRSSGALATSALVRSSPWLPMLNSAAYGGGSCEPDNVPYGPLRDPDENGIMLPEGFQSRVVARAGEH